GWTGGVGPGGWVVSAVAAGELSRAVRGGEGENGGLWRWRPGEPGWGGLGRAPRAGPWDAVFTGPAGRVAAVDGAGALPTITGSKWNSPGPARREPRWGRSSVLVERF